MKPRVFTVLTPRSEDRIKADSWDAAIEAARLITKPGIVAIGRLPHGDVRFFKRGEKGAMFPMTAEAAAVALMEDIAK